jgi:hypothetical protein
MGWEQVPWYTLTDDFDADFGVNEWHGTNAFFRDGDRIFRTYFINERGDEAMAGIWGGLDITALGRQEEWEDSPEGYPQTQTYAWWNLHDEYDETTSFEAGLADAAPATPTGAWHASGRVAAQPRTPQPVRSSGRFSANVPSSIPVACPISMR